MPRPWLPENSPPSGRSASNADLSSSIRTPQPPSATSSDLSTASPNSTSAEPGHSTSSTPLGQLLPGLDAAGLDLDSVLITVTGREIIDHHDAKIEAYIVEGGGARAWVASDGRVLRQEVNLPLVGQITLRDEPYDELAFEEAFDSVPNESFNRFRVEND